MHDTMDEYAKEMAELKGLITRALEKKGVLAKIKAELRSNIFEVIEEQDKEGTGLDAPPHPSSASRPKAVVGCCSEQAKVLHETKSGHLLTSLVCEYLEWAELDHTLRVYLPESNLPSSYPRRGKLEEELGLPSSVSVTSLYAQKPLLLELVETYQAQKAALAKAATAAAAAASASTQGGGSSGGGAGGSSNNTTTSSSLLSRVGSRSSSPAGARSPRSTSPLLSRGFSPFSGRDRGGDKGGSHGHGHRNSSSSGSHGGGGGSGDHEDSNHSSGSGSGGGAFSRLPLSLLRDLPSSRD